jgi:hypothetical protein
MVTVLGMVGDFMHRVGVVCMHVVIVGRLTSGAARTRTGKRNGSGEDRAEQRQEDDRLVHRYFPGRMT